MAVTWVVPETLAWQGTQIFLLSIATPRGVLDGEIGPYPDVMDDENDHYAAPAADSATKDKTRHGRRVWPGTKEKL
jgi:hypothetical protein